MACRSAYTAWQEAFQERLIAAGCTSPRTSQLALLIIVGIEGANTVARTFHSTEPFTRVADEIGRLLRAELAERASVGSVET